MESAPVGSSFFDFGKILHPASIALNSVGYYGCFSLAGWFCAGAPGGTRTPNPLIRSQMLYPIELPVRRTAKQFFGAGEGLSSFAGDWARAMTDSYNLHRFDSFACGVNKRNFFCDLER